MANSIVIPSRERREKQHLFIGGREIYGVQSLTSSYNVGAFPIEYLGMSQTSEYPNSAQMANVSINTLMIERDPFINYTGNTPINGYVVNDASIPGGDNFSFTSAYLTSYNARCAIGQIPEVSVEMLVVGNAGYISEGLSPTTDADFAVISSYASGINQSIASYGTIDVTLDELTTNRLQSFQISIVTPRNPVYELGSRTPYLVDQLYPIEVSANFTIDANDYLAYRLNTYPCSTDVRNLSFNFKNYQTDASIISYSFANMKFQGLKYSTDINSNVSVELNYRGYIEAPNSGISSFRCDSTMITADNTNFTADFAFD